MSKTNEPNANDILAGQIMQPPAADKDEAALRKQLLTLQLRELSESLGEKDEEKALRNRARKAMAEKMEQARKAEIAAQDACAHKKPNGETALAGQWDENKNNILICQYCAKVWNDGKSIPFDLRIDINRLGGPEYAGSRSVAL